MSYVCLIDIIGAQCFMNHVANLKKHDARIPDTGGVCEGTALADRKSRVSGYRGSFPDNGAYITDLLLHIGISTFPTSAQSTSLLDFAKGTYHLPRFLKMTNKYY